MNKDGNVAIGTGGGPENAEGWVRTLDILGTGNTKLSVRTGLIDARDDSRPNDSVRSQMRRSETRSGASRRQGHR